MNKPPIQQSIPRLQPQYIERLRTFKGIDMRENQFVPDVTSCKDMLNMYVDEHKLLSNRPKLSLRCEMPGVVKSAYKLVGRTLILLVTGVLMFMSSSCELTTIDNPDNIVVDDLYGCYEYKDKVYITPNLEIVNNKLQVVEPYIPTTMIGRSELTPGTPLEDFNILTSNHYEKWFWDGRWALDYTQVDYPGKGEFVEETYSSFEDVSKTIPDFGMWGINAQYDVIFKPDTLVLEQVCDTGLLLKKLNTTANKWEWYKLKYGEGNEPELLTPPTDMTAVMQSPEYYIIYSAKAKNDFNVIVWNKYTEVWVTVFNNNYKLLDNYTYGMVGSDPRKWYCWVPHVDAWDVSNTGDTVVFTIAQSLINSGEGAYTWVCRWNGTQYNIFKDTPTYVHSPNYTSNGIINYVKIADNNATILLGSTLVSRVYSSASYFFRRQNFMYPIAELYSFFVAINGTNNFTPMLTPGVSDPISGTYPNLIYTAHYNINRIYTSPNLTKVMITPLGRNTTLYTRFNVNTSDNSAFSLPGIEFYYIVLTDNADMFIFTNNDIFYIDNTSDIRVISRFRLKVKPSLENLFWTNYGISNMINFTVKYRDVNNNITEFKLDFDSFEAYVKFKREQIDPISVTTNGQTTSINLQELRDELLTSDTSILYANRYWLGTDDFTFASAVLDWSYYPISFYNEYPNKKITGFNQVGEDALAIFHTRGYYLVSRLTADNFSNFAYNEMKSKTGNIAKKGLILTRATELPIQVFNDGLYGLLLVENIATTERNVVNITNNITEKLLKEDLTQMRSFNSYIWTFFILPNGHMYIFDNGEWYYWEIPYEITYAYSDNDNTIFIISKDKLLFFDKTNDNNYYDYKDDNKRPYYQIEWYWQSQRLNLKGEQKQLEWMRFLANHTEQEKYDFMYELRAWPVDYGQNEARLNGNIDILGITKERVFVHRFEYLELKLFNRELQRHEVEKKPNTRLRLNEIDFYYKERRM